MALVCSSSWWTRFWRELREALWEEVKDELLELAIRYLYDKLFNRRHEEAAPAQFPDLTEFLVNDDESASEAAVFGPRPPRALCLGDGSVRPGFLVFLDDGVARAPPFASVDHI
ncbi:uncharacterized protein [Triticum aestivum]|uniref:uncharacterized protein n=1 Tax=Triticum aestivum TaxID=4565 RepID=UPI001D0118AC|nr:uncharacterized protein LOC123147574 [Triticum aestivum]